MLRAGLRGLVHELPISIAFLAATNCLTMRYSEPGLRDPNNRLTFPALPHRALAAALACSGVRAFALPVPAFPPFALNCL